MKWTRTSERQEWTSDSGNFLISHSWKLPEVRDFSVLAILDESNEDGDVTLEYLGRQDTSIGAKAFAAGFFAAQKKEARK